MNLFIFFLENHLLPQEREIDNSNTKTRISPKGKEYDIAIRESYFFP